MNDLSGKKHCQNQNPHKNHYKHLFIFWSYVYYDYWRETKLDKILQVSEKQEVIEECIEPAHKDFEMNLSK